MQLVLAIYVEHEPHWRLEQQLLEKVKEVCQSLHKVNAIKRAL